MNTKSGGKQENHVYNPNAARKQPAWIKTELRTGVERVIRAQEVGKHHRRIKEQRADIDNNTPRNFEHVTHLRFKMFQNELQYKQVKTEQGNIELLRHLITLSQDPPSYKTHAKSDLLKFSQKMGKLARKSRAKHIAKENKILQNRLKSIEPDGTITVRKLAKDFDEHKRLKKNILLTGKSLRKAPDVIKYNKPNLSKEEKYHFRTPLRRPSYDDYYTPSYQNINDESMLSNSSILSKSKSKSPVKLLRRSQTQRSALITNIPKQHNISMSSRTSSKMTTPDMYHSRRRIFAQKSKNIEKSLQDKQNKKQKSGSNSRASSLKFQIQSSNQVCGAKNQTSIRNENINCINQQSRSRQRPQTAINHATKIKRQEMSDIRSNLQRSNSLINHKTWDEMIASDIKDLDGTTSPRLIGNLSKGLPIKFHLTMSPPLSYSQTNHQYRDKMLQQLSSHRHISQTIKSAQTLPKSATYIQHASLIYGKAWLPKKTKHCMQSELQNHDCNNINIENNHQHNDTNTNDNNTDIENFVAATDNNQTSSITTNDNCNNSNSNQSTSPRTQTEKIVIPQPCEINMSD